MYAIADIKGKQYKLEQGRFIDVSFFNDKQDGEIVEIPNILLTSDNGTVKVGQPYLEGAKAVATVKQNLIKGKKVTTVKYKRRKHSKVTKGQRAYYTRLTIDSIDA